MNSARSWLMWSVALFAYVIAVLQRTSLGVAGVQAADRFDISASVLSSLVVLQIIVYAGLQIPVGVLLDRVGPKFLIASGAVLMMVGQVALALSPSIGIAIAGRILVGAGDAMTFISVIRLLASWFSGRILPQLSQWTGNIGALGQVLSAVPLSWALHNAGWSTSFVAAAALSAVAFVLVFVLLADGHEPAAVAAVPRIRRPIGVRPSASCGKAWPDRAPSWASGRRSSRCPPGRRSACCGASPRWSAGSAIARRWPPGCSRSSSGWDWSAAQSWESSPRSSRCVAPA